MDSEVCRPKADHSFLVLKFQDSVFKSVHEVTEPANKKSTQSFRGGSIGMGLGAVALQFADFIRTL